MTVEMPLLGDPRLERLAYNVALWSVVWALLLNAIPVGKSGRNHIVTLNAAHGVVSTVVATLTIWYGYETAMSTAVSLSYFLVDLVAMVHADRKMEWKALSRSRKMDYAHHVMGVCWGTVFFHHEATVCDTSLGNPYVWIQTNEVSTPFYNWFRLTNSTVAGILFVLSFFLSRIVFNTLYLIPRLLRVCDHLYFYGCMPFFVLQYIWFVMIAKRMTRTVRVANRVPPPTMTNSSNDDLTLLKKDQ